MRRSFEMLRMRSTLSVAVAAILLAACSDKASTDSAAGAGSSTAASSESPAATPSSNQAQESTGASAASGPALGGRTGELVNSDNSTMVFLYYDLAGIAPPIDNWVEEDSRVKYGPAIEKASRRIAIKAELESAKAAVKGMGFIRLSMNANLSDYDPSYEEFSVRALAPSSVITFDSFGQKVSLRFANGKTAQIWKVPVAESQAIRDKIGYAGTVTLDALLKVTGVQPGPGGGTISVDVLDYDLQQSSSGVTVGRVKVAQP